MRLQSRCSSPAPIGTRCSLWITDRLLTTVEIACLKINCSWLLFSKQHGVFVEGTDLSRQFDSADEIDRDRSLVFADRIKKRVLNVLCRLVFHAPISPRRFLFVETNYLRNTETETAANTTQPN